MKKINYYFGFMAIAGLLFLDSCKKDDPTFGVTPGNITATEYTAGGTLSFLYSIDGGTTFKADIPSGLKSGTVIKIKINNGTIDLKADDFSFDWSKTTPAPTDPAAEVAEVKVGGGNINLDVTVADIYSLVTSNRTSGKFYVVNPTTGTTTEAFTPTYNSAALNEVRAFVYHPKQKLFYASVNSYVNQGSIQAGFLYSINTNTKVATRINQNNGAGGAAIWDAIVNWAVAADDSLISVGDFNGDGNGIVKFGVNGGRSKRTIKSDICCGLGILYTASNNTFTIHNAWNDNQNMTTIQTLNGATGVLSNKITITNYQGFTEAFTSSYAYLKAMAKAKDGTIYGILFSTSSKKSYFVKVNLTGTANITFVSTLGADNNNQYNNLTYIPNYTF